MRVLQWLCQWNFGRFEEKEFRKFLFMGLIFALIIGIYWTLRPLKDALFIQYVDRLQLPYAKTVSVLALFPLVIFYTKLLEKFSKEKMLLFLPTFYSLGILSFTLLFALNLGELIEMVLGYVWYLYVESYGSLMVALFWAFSADTTEPGSAKRGFSLVVAIGQIGGIILPFGVGGLPYRLGLQTDTLSMLILSGLLLGLIPLILYFFRSTPKELLQSYQKEQKPKNEHKAGFFEGLKLLLRNRYLLGIFAANFVYEVVVTIIDFNFKIKASLEYSGVALSHYLSVYGSSVNIVSLSCLLLGVSQVTRLLGISVALVSMPVIIAMAYTGFLTIDTLEFLFFLMIGSKAINYALNGPALKQLYIPTSAAAKFKAQAWIETFGSRSSKQAASFFNMSLAPLQKSLGQVAGRSTYLVLSSAICLPLLALWLVAALFLGKNYNKAIKKGELVC